MALHHDIKHQHNHDSQHEHEEHEGSLLHELMHHLPYAIFSVAFALIILSLVTYGGGHDTSEAITDRADALFHNFHFLHIIFAAVGTVVTYLRFSRAFLPGLLMGIFSPAIFCTLSDAVLPYYGGRMLGVTMDWHICFYSELANILPFLLTGVLTGFVMGHHHYTKLGSFSVGSHFIHILVSSMAASLYLLANGFFDWSHQIGYVFLFLIVAVLIPCTISDVVVPMIFAKRIQKK